MRFVLPLMGIAAMLAAGAEWPQFRGANASGVAEARNLPVEFGKDKNMVWRTELPAGHSSPSIAGDKIFVTGYDETKLYTFALDRGTGRILWRREAPRPRVSQLHKANSPASATPVTDGKDVFVFFTDYGLLSYGPDGNERWRVPLGPFKNPFGQAASPILAEGLVLQACDQESGSFFLAVDKDNGEVKWMVERPESTRGFSTPILYQPESGGLQVLLAGSYELSAYDVKTGKKQWWVGGLTWQLKPTPVIGDGKVFVQGWAGEADPGQQEEIPSYADVLGKWDQNKDGNLQKSEVPESEKAWKKFSDLDLDFNGVIGDRDWKMYQRKRSVVNAIKAFKLGGEGDMTDKNFLWAYSKSLPNVPSPLYHDGVLYMLKEGGILTSLNPDTGEEIKRARLTGALGDYFSSTVAADGKIYAVSHEGKVTVLKAGGDWEVLAVNDLGEMSNSTPAVVDNKLFIRTHQAMYCFAK